MKLRSLMFTIALAAAACGGKKPANTTTTQADTSGTKPLYDRLGGVDAIKAVVKDFVEERVAKDSRINARFGNADIPHLEQMLTDQICNATGGPCKYTGKNMKEAHAGMGINDAEFGALVEDLKASLAKFNVPQKEQDELIGALAKMHDDIVEKKG
jgi:hemoglobin